MVGPSLDTAKNRHPKPPATATTTTTTIKFLCSYGGKILPRYPDGKLRYHGGETRVLAVDRSIPFAELLKKMGELCGGSVNLRCQLPKEDLDALVSVTSDEDLANLIEEYDRAAAASLKIRAFLSSPKKVVSSPPLPPSSSSFQLSSSSSSSSSSSTGSNTAAAPRCHHLMAKQPVAYPVRKMYGYHAHGNPGRVYLVHNGNHWQ